MAHVLICRLGLRLQPDFQQCDLAVGETFDRLCGPSNYPYKHGVACPKRHVVYGWFEGVGGPSSFLPLSQSKAVFPKLGREGVLWFPGNPPPRPKRNGRRGHRLGGAFFFLDPRSGSIRPGHVRWLSNVQSQNMVPKESANPWWLLGNVFFVFFFF